MTPPHFPKDGGHRHAPPTFERAFAIGVALNLGYVALEAAFGILAGSLALIADAGHNMFDVFGLLLAWGASWLASKPPQGRKTYGYKRTPILASLANGLILLVAVGAIGWEAVRRLIQPEPVASWTIIWVATIGVFVNGITTWLFASGRKRDLNIRGAFSHMAADTGVTAGVIAAALVIHWTGWRFIDPVVSIVIALVILVSTWSLLRDSVILAIDAVPPDVELDKVQAHLANLPGIDEVHDLHVWALSTTEIALTAHLVCADVEQGQKLLVTLPHDLLREFGIDHTTIQIEKPYIARHCGLRAPDIV